MQTPPQQEQRSNPADIPTLARLLELRNSLGFVYGSEDTAMLFYALIRREQPTNIVEFGTGLGVTAAWMAQAAKENGAGQVWSLDDGSQWEDPQKMGAALNALSEAPSFAGLAAERPDYPTLIRRLGEELGLQDRLTFLLTHADMKSEEGFNADAFPFLAKPIDFLFLDINRTPDEILDSLYLLLPHLAESASVFIDSASTSVVGYLFLEKLVDQLNHSKVPRRFLAGKSADRRQALTDLVAQRRFTLMHMVERLNRAQNSSAWIRIEPNDYIPHPKVPMKWV